MTAILALQSFHVLFLALHDWVPLGKLNNVKAASNPGGELMLNTVVSTTPYAFGLVASIFYWPRGLPGWLHIYLLISYGLLFLGELKAWWIPYFFGAKPELVSRYQAMFGGILPNTLHVFLHSATVALLILLAVPNA
jgi:hypothetical protein